MQPNLREHGWLEVTLQNDRARAVVVVDLARDDGRVFFIVSISQLKVEPNSASPWWTLTGPPSRGSPISPAVRPGRSERQYRSPGHPGCSGPPGNAPAT